MIPHHLTPAARIAAILLAVSGALATAGCGMFDQTVIANAAPAPGKVSPARAQEIVSAWRRQHGLPPLQTDPALQNAAQKQALAMARANRLSHDVAGSLRSRISDLPHTVAAENVSAGYATMDRAITSWKTSPSHNENLLNPNVRRMGIAAAQAPGTRFGSFWALVLTD